MAVWQEKWRRLETHDRWEVAVSDKWTGWVWETTEWRNVRGEPVFSVMAAGWFCEKSGWIGKVEDVKPVLLKYKRISAGNHFEEEGFYPDELWNRRISSGLIHLGSYIIWFIGFKLSICCSFVAVWWMANMLSFCFIIAFHNFATLENWLTCQCPSSWPVVITIRKN